MLASVVMFFARESQAAEKFLVVEDVKIEGENFFSDLPRYFQQALEAKLQEKGFALVFGAGAEGMPRLKIRLFYHPVNSSAGHLTVRAQFVAAGRVFKIGGSPLDVISESRKEGINEVAEHIVNCLVYLWASISTL